MDLLKQFIEILLHPDKPMEWALTHYGAWTYGILFLIIFCETGLVVTPFLPGDSLLFVAGVLATKGLNIHLLVLLLIFAAILGDTVNYHIGKFVGHKAFAPGNRWLKKEYLDKAHAFYEKHGGKAIVLARFVPIIRTFVPFVAGIGEMNYATFLFYNAIGGTVWVAAVTYLGFFCGGIPLLKDHLELLVLGIVALSLVPIVIEVLRHRNAPTPPSNPDQSITPESKP